MKKLMHIMFLSCLKATELMEKKLHFKLSGKEKIQLEMHVMMCSACTNYEKQDLIIEKSIKKQTEAKDAKIDLEKFKKEIIEEISK